MTDPIISETQDAQIDFGGGNKIDIVDDPAGFQLVTIMVGGQSLPSQPISQQAAQKFYRVLGAAIQARIAALQITN